MANGRNLRPKGDAGRDTGGFVAIPWPVLDSAAYKGLSHPAKALLIEMAQARIDRGRADSRNRQGPPSEQGELVCGDMAGAGLAPWRSGDVRAGRIRGRRSADDHADPRRKLRQMATAANVI